MQHQEGLSHSEAGSDVSDDIASIRSDDEDEQDVGWGNFDFSDPSDVEWHCTFCGNINDPWAIDQCCKCGVLRFQQDLSVDHGFPEHANVNKYVVNNDVYASVDSSAMRARSVLDLNQSVGEVAPPLPQKGLEKYVRNVHANSVFVLHPTNPFFSHLASSTDA